MDKQEIRRQFEEWMSDNWKHQRAIEKVGDTYILATTRTQWEAWQASRAAIVVELPDRMTEVVADTLIHGRVMANDMHTACSNAIRAAGLSIKGE